MKTGNTWRDDLRLGCPGPASMEPGHEDREYQDWDGHSGTWDLASMEPGHEDREYSTDPAIWHDPMMASMEPGHEDREYVTRCDGHNSMTEPQWSPVMKTGNTAQGRPPEETHH